VIVPVVSVAAASGKSNRAFRPRTHLPSWPVLVSVDGDRICRHVLNLEGANSTSSTAPGPVNRFDADQRPSPMAHHGRPLPLPSATGHGRPSPISKAKSKNATATVSNSISYRAEMEAKGMRFPVFPGWGLVEIAELATTPSCWARNSIRIPVAPQPRIRCSWLS
jgi:hypothetical protein